MYEVNPHDAEPPRRSSRKQSKLTVKTIYILARVCTAGNTPPLSLRLSQRPCKVPCLPLPQNANARCTISITFSPNARRSLQLGSRLLHSSIHRWSSPASRDHRPPDADRQCHHCPFSAHPHSGIPSLSTLLTSSASSFFPTAISHFPNPGLSTI